MFKDRLDAALQMVSALQKYRDQHPLVLAIPRGAVPMGVQIAQALNGPFDVVLVRKLRAPAQEEVAVGAVDESGATFIAPWAREMGADVTWLKTETARQMQTLRHRRQQYTHARPAVAVQGRVLIVVDDGLATGATMMSALKAVRRQHPARLICAVPVASAEALRRITPLADEVVCLSVPPDFQGVGQFYRHFPQIDDAEVIRLLSECAAAVPHRAPVGQSPLTG
jgi:putative phosphoribosyl transferase